MRGVRKLIAWTFAFVCFVCLWIGVRDIGRAYRHIAVVPFVLTNLRVLVVPVVFSALAALFGTAWWTEWKERPSATRWGIAASLVNILLPLGHIVFFSRGNWNRGVTVLAVGVVGIVAFLWPRDTDAGPEDSGLEDKPSERERLA
jgi:hypothetical protein